MNNNEMIKRALILEVPFKEKEQAKTLGAKWDPDIRKWFVPEGLDPASFVRWFPRTGGENAYPPRRSNSKA